MSRRRTRRRRRSGVPWSSLALAALVLVAGVVAGTGALDAAATTTMGADRGVGADVTIDDTGAHGLDTAAAVQVGATDPLVNVTNRLGRPVTVTVTLRSDSTHLGDLVVDGSTEGDRASFSLGNGATEVVSLAVPDDGSLAGQAVYYHVNASATGLDVSATDRSTPVEGT